MPVTSSLASITDAILAVRNPHSPQTIGGTCGWNLTLVSSVVDVTDIALLTV